MKDLWDLQKGFNDRFFGTRGGWPRGERPLIDATKDFALHLIKEITEVFDELSWKMHRAPKDHVNRHNILEELVDCQKFLFGLAQVWGFTYEDYENEFRRKSMVVEQRFAQEQSLATMANDPCAIIDIDGVLSDWPRCFFDWMLTHELIIAKLDGTISTPGLHRAWESLGIVEQERIKSDYRSSGVKATLPVLPGAKDLLDLIHSKGIKIVLLTTRPYDEHYRIYPDTLTWLKNNELKYDAIIWGKDKGFDAVKLFKNILWAVDDQDRNITRLRAANITSCLLNPEDPRMDTQAFFRWANSYQKIENVGYNWQRSVVDRVRAGKEPIAPEPQETANV